jgi:hypothetical protein
LLGDEHLRDLESLQGQFRLATISGDRIAAAIISAMLRLVVEHLAQRLSPFLFVATEAVWSGEMGSHGLGSFP